ncbi:MAG: AbrB family transcriptional regulator [Anaerolinea sp.]|nr:AbrB family transcriptional regulator [Anaerolinea sp.]
MAQITGSVRLSKDGRIVLPAKVRRALELKSGDELLVRVEDGEILLMTRMQRIRRAQRMASPFVKDRPSLADELIAERREEPAREN